MWANGKKERNTSFSVNAAPTEATKFFIDTIVINTPLCVTLTPCQQTSDYVSIKSGRDRHGNGARHG